MRINILGTFYDVILNAKEKDYPKLKNCDGYTDFSIKQIVVAKLEKDESSIEDLDGYAKKVLRHEIIHAFLYESGLDANCWARNEEIVDWIAIQFEKLLDTFIRAGAITFKTAKEKEIKVNINPPKIDLSSINKLNKEAEKRIPGGSV